MLSLLDSIDVGSMKDNDRHYHALLRIKAQDKAFVRHTSDSVILKVIDYYSRHKESGLYPEALYYGGRVYSDLGDAPTSIRYFQDALDILPENSDNNFRATILAQTGWLLNSVHLYSEAAKYLKEAITIGLANQDTINIMRDTQLLGAIFLHLKDYEKADSCIHQALYWANKVSPIDTIQQKMYLAAIHMDQNQMDSAFYYISQITPSSGNKYQNMINAYAANIYLKVGMPDSAFIYAKRLISSENINYKKIGYYIMLSPELRSFSTPDSLLLYSLAYSDILDEYLDIHDGEQVTLQTSLYNYQKHDRDRIKAEKSEKFYMLISVITFLLILVLGYVVIFIRNKNTQTLLQYHKALDDIKRLKDTIASESNENLEILPKLIYGDSDNELNPRERLKNELLELQNAGMAQRGDPNEILGSSLFDELNVYINRSVAIPEISELWEKVECAVLGLSPNFKERLYLLVGDNLKEDAYRMTLLIRCGFKPSEVAVLWGRSKGALSSRRGYICEQIFGKKLGAKVMDDIIMLL